MKLCVVKYSVSSSCQHVGCMELISLSPVVPLTVPTCALLEEIVEGPCIWQVILFLYLLRAILRSQGTGGEKYDYFIGICTNPNPELVTDKDCMVIQLNSTNPAKGTGICLGKKDGAQLTDTLSKCLSLCHDLHHVFRTPPTVHHVHCKQWIFLATQACILTSGLSATQIWPGLHVDCTCTIGLSLWIIQCFYLYRI